MTWNGAGGFGEFWRKLETAVLTTATHWMYRCHVLLQVFVHILHSYLVFHGCPHHCHDPLTPLVNPPFHTLSLFFNKNRKRYKWRGCLWGTRVSHTLSLAWLSLGAVGSEKTHKSGRKRCKMSRGVARRRPAWIEQHLCRWHWTPGTDHVRVCNVRYSCVATVNRDGLVFKNMGF